MADEAEAWRAGFNAALRAWLQGQPLTPIDMERAQSRWHYSEAFEMNGQKYDLSTYGYTDWKAEEHLAVEGCGWVFHDTTRFQEHAHSAFQGTFTENEDVALIIVIDVSCRCGRISHSAATWTGTIGEAIQGMLGSGPI